MTLPQASPEDVQEQESTVVEQAPATSEPMPYDAPEADVAEQRLEVDLDEEDAPIG
jgi:hypothetical protein